MQQSEAAFFLQSLRGNQALVILAFLTLQRGLTLEDIEGATNLHNDTVRKSLQGLAAKGLLCMQRGEHGRQTWLPVGNTFFARLFEQNPKISDSGLVVVNVESEESQFLYSTSLTAKAQNPKISDSGAEPEYWQHLPKPIEEIRQCLALLRSYGVVGKKANQIAEDHHITAEMIRAHAAWVKSEKWDNPNGMMIYRLINHLDAPEVNANGHVAECRCKECLSLAEAARYTDSAFSAYLHYLDEQEERETP